MPEQFLYEQLDTLSQWGSIKREVPDSVAQNLNPKYELRPYQVGRLCPLFSLLQKRLPQESLSFATSC